VTPWVEYAHWDRQRRWKIRMQFEIEDSDEEHYTTDQVIFDDSADGCVLRVSYTYTPCGE